MSDNEVEDALQYETDSQMQGNVPLEEILDEVEISNIEVKAASDGNNSTDNVAEAEEPSVAAESPLEIEKESFKSIINLDVATSKFWPESGQENTTYVQSDDENDNNSIPKQKKRLTLFDSDSEDQTFSKEEETKSVASDSEEAQENEDDVHSKKQVLLPV